MEDIVYLEYIESLTKSLNVFLVGAQLFYFILLGELIYYV
jgi:hypothetical protein